MTAAGSRVDAGIILLAKVASAVDALNVPGSVSLRFELVRTEESHMSNNIEGKVVVIHGREHVINVSSVAGHKVRAGGVVYAATKHAVRVISEGLREEVKPYDIRTTVISPGAVDTELTDSITEPDVAENLKKFYAQVAVPADSFARAVAFAISEPAEVDINEILYRPTRQEY
jgi:NADP-dependent 3-hydroxy acid dehydrogenase YdfG